MAVRVIFVDSNRLIRDGIKHALNNETGIVCAGEESTARGAVDLLSHRAADVVVVDYFLADGDALDVLTEAGQRDIPVRWIVTMNGLDEMRVLELLRRGPVRGIVLKTESLDTLFAAIRHVAEGRTFFSGGIAGTLMAGAFGVLPHASHLLTPRERQIVRLIYERKSSKEIAAFMQREESTVRTFRKSIFKKLHVRNVPEMILKAIELGLLPKP